MSRRQLADDSESRKADLYLESLEKIDDDCDVAGINFVKVDDAKTAAKEYGLEELPRLVLFKNKLPNVFEGSTRMRSATARSAFESETWETALFGGLSLEAS